MGSNSARRSCRLFVAAAALVAATGACGRAVPLDESALGDLEDARREARRAVEEVGALRERVDVLEAGLGSARRGQRALRREAAGRSKRTKTALASLRAALGRLRGDSAGASERAGAALAAAQEAARDLTVLTGRFDYHLRRHGGT